MHKLIEYICDELDALERKADTAGKLTISEVQYGDMLAHFKKNLLKAEEMSDGYEYSNRGDYSRRGMDNSYRYEGEGSYARGRRNAKRDSRGRYSRERGYSMYSEDMADELRNLMDNAPDEKTRMEFQRFIDKVENMN